MNFNQWLDTFIEEKDLDTEHLFEKEGASGLNLIPLCVLVDAIKGAPKSERDAIKKMVIGIDFVNGDVMDYFDHLAGAIAR